MREPPRRIPCTFSYLDLRLQPTVIEGTLVAHMFDVAHDLNVEPPEKLLDPAFAATRAGAIIELLSPRLMLGADGTAAARGMVERGSRG